MTSIALFDHAKSSYLMTVETLSGQVESLAASKDHLFRVSDEHHSRPVLNATVEMKTDALQGLQTRLTALLKDLAECQSDIENYQEDMENALQSLESESQTESLNLSNTVAQDTDAFQGLIQSRLKEEQGFDKMAKSMLTMFNN